MMRDNRIMRTDRPGGNIRLFLCKMKKKKKEVENMKSKYRFRRILSGVMAAVTILSTFISPLTVYASEEPKAAEPPAYESVKDQLDEEEVVKATDLELEVGQDFDVSTDFTNLEIKDESKVKVTFQKAENDAGENFSTSHADTYHAVYYVEPVNQNHPVYQIGRNLIVKEPVTAAQSEPQTEQAVTEEDTGSDDEEAASQEETETVPVETEIVEPETAESETEEPEETEPEFQDGLSESEFDAALEESETENTTDEESGLTLSDVLEQAGEQDIDLMAMEDGETVSFTAVNTSTRVIQDVDVTRGAAYYYADYGLGSYVTYKYTVKFGNVSATAYCVQPSKAGPGDGVYKITKLGDSKALAKVCYYGTKASGENGFFSEKHPDFSAGKQFIIVHLAASYANNSSDAFSGTNATGQALAMELYNYCMSQPEIPEVDMSFSNANVTAYISGNSQRTEEITFKASELQTITMKLPSGVKLHNVTTGKTSSAGASVEICGGTKFYLSAPLTQAVDVKGEWSVTMKGSIIKDYSAYKITTGSETQDLALVFGEGVTDEKYVDFKVSWVKQATLEIVKKDRKSNKAIAGAVYGVYSDKDGKNLITKMPATDANGASSVTITKTQDTVSGRFVCGGLDADTGLTGRKLMVDTYGSLVPHGGGAFSGKDCSKVDRSGAYMARYIAKNMVAAGLASRCQVSLAYAIGVAQPVMVQVDTFGTGKICADDCLAAAIPLVFGLTPSQICDTLHLKRPIYRQSAVFGHFGRKEFPWEKTDKAEQLRDTVM